MEKGIEKNGQLIISVGREFGSGGRKIAEILAEAFELPLYDYNLLQQIAGDKNVNVDEMKKYDELPHVRLVSRRVKGLTNSPYINVAIKEFEFIKDLADKGESFVIVGRCAETVLRDNKALISIFILGDMKNKIEKIQASYGISKDEAKALIYKTNRQRKAYHNYYCDVSWGDSRNYDISINSSKLGLEKTAEVLISYIKDRLDARQA